MMTIDVAIAGGGPAASAAALTLARHGLSCTIVERRDDEGAKPGESLPPSARSLLEQLDISGALKADGHLPCHGNRSVWGSDRVEELPFVMTPYGHGWHLDRRRFERLLIDRACDAGATRMTRTNVERIERDGDCWRLTLDRGEIRFRDLLMNSAFECTFAAERYFWIASSAGAPIGQTRSFRPFSKTRTDSV